MQVKLWGVRGSLPSPTTNTEYRKKLVGILQRFAQSDIKRIDTDSIDSFIDKLPDEYQFIFGGDTTCVTVKSNSGKLYILDCGTGIRHVGYQLMKGLCGKGSGEVNIFFTHNHWDHIQGLPFFTPLYVPGNRINFYSTNKKVEENLIKQMSSPFFPAPFENTSSEKIFHYLDPKNRKSIRLEDDLILEYYPLKHPGGSFAYKFIQNGKSFIFATDAEFTGEILEKIGEETDFFSNADLLVLDSQYTLQESFSKFDWGHTSYTMAVNCGLRWNIKNLVLTHHEPAYSDFDLAEIHSLAIEHGRQMENSNMKIFLAREGMIFRI